MQRKMTFDRALSILMGVAGDMYDGELDDARHVVTRDVAAVLGIDDNDGALGDWIANGNYCGIEDAELLAEEWRRWTA